MARARKVWGVVGGIGLAVVLAVTGGAWLWRSGVAGEKVVDHSPAVAPGAVAAVPASRPVADPTSVRLASDVRRPVGSPATPARPASTGNSANWVDSVLSGSKTQPSSVLGDGLPTSIDLSAPPAPVSGDLPLFGTK